MNEEILIVFETDIFKIKYEELNEILLNRNPFWEEYVIKDIVKRPYQIRDEDGNIITRYAEMVSEYKITKQVFFILDFFIDESTFNYIMDGYNTIMIVNSHKSNIMNNDESLNESNVQIFRGIPINRDDADKVYISTKVQSDLNFELIDINVSPDELNISNQNLKNLPPIYSHIKSLDCSNNELTELNGLPRFLEILNCRRNNLTKLENLPSLIYKLNCGGNQLQELKNLPSSLDVLICSDNSIQEVKLPRSLKKISISNNKLLNIDNFPSSLESIYADNNLIYFVNELPINLKKLNLQENNIVGIQEFNDLLEEFELDNNFLRYLPTLPPSLKLGYLTGNPNIILNNDDIIGKSLGVDEIITTVDGDTYEEYFEVITEKDRLSTEENTLFLNKNMEIKEISLTNENINTIFGNGCENLTDIINLPPELIELCCSSNPNLININYFPPTLLFLFLSNNPNLEKLPSLPSSLYCLICNNCNLKSLPPLPENLVIFDCRNNPDITVSEKVYNEYSKSFDKNIYIIKEEEKIIENKIQEEIDDEILDLSNKNLINIDRYIENKIKYLICNKNQIERIERLPKYLILFDCSDNNLKVLPQLPDTLEDLNCSNNELRNLPLLPENLLKLDCRYNDIQEILELPSSLEELNCQGNYNLHISANIYNRFPNSFSDGITIITQNI